MRSSVDWLDDAENASAEERATMADFRLFIAGQNVTQHLFGDESCDHLTLPLCHLAEGLAHDWWLLFGGRDLDISLVRHRMGYAVPDVRLRFDGAAFEVEARQRRYLNPDVRFWGGPSEVLTRPEAETRLSELISGVLDRLEERGVGKTSAALRWARVQASRSDSEEAAFCEAAGALRLDPYAIEDASAALIEQAAGLFEGEPLMEFLSGVGLARGQQTLEWVQQAERRAPYKSRLPRLRAVSEAAAAHAPARPGEASWALGYRRARAARGNLDLGQADRLRSFRDLTRRLEAPAFDLASSVNGLRALRLDRTEAIHVHLRKQGDRAEARAGHNFAFGRAVGDAVCFPDPGRFVVNELRHASRQAAGRAFAAEFLAPVDEVRSMLDDGLDVITIAAEFGVATTVIEHQISNEERIRAACMTDAI